MCKQQGKDKLRSTPHGIKSLSSDLFGFWRRLGVRDITCSSVIYMMKQNWKISSLNKKQSTTRFVQIVMTARNKRSISEADNSVEPIPSLSCSFRKTKSRCCPVLSATKKIYQRTYMLLALIMLKGKYLMFNTTKVLQKNRKIWPLNSDNPSPLALISTGELVAN